MATEEAPNTSTSLYSHEETVAAITSYYELVSSVHSIATYSKLLYPPPEGWPQLAGDDMAAGLLHSEEAVKLIRHMPYFDMPDMIQILPDVEPISYIDEERVRRFAYVGKALRNGAIPQKGERNIPPHIVWLGHRPHEREYGHSVWLDTKLGNVILGNHHGEVEFSGVAGTQADGIWPDDDSYDDLFVVHGIRGHGVPIRIATFFAACERSLRTLEWLPGMDEDIGEDGFLLDDMDDLENTNLTYEQRIKIMLDNGWPDDDWNVEGAKRDLKRLLDMVYEEGNGEEGNGEEGNGEEGNGEEGNGEEVPVAGGGRWSRCLPM
ncbi:hypothetical protein F4776DRAFT_497021 [Hypoxylon sp. NC0597]|nr:hypothetical protein F4776DRAFT_497021 [Hypoxylon sp. NC0597]